MLQPPWDEALLLHSLFDCGRLEFPIYEESSLANRNSSKPTHRRSASYMGHDGRSTGSSRRRSTSRSRTAQYQRPRRTTRSTDGEDVFGLDSTYSLIKIRSPRFTKREDRSSANPESPRTAPYIDKPRGVVFASTNSSSSSSSSGRRGRHIRRSTYG